MRGANTKGWSLVASYETARGGTPSKMKDRAGGCMVGGGELSDSHTHIKTT